MPNGSGEKAKGAIFCQAVQYFHHLKENEARNIEKRTSKSQATIATLNISFFIFF
jgi:hypothetical protein